MKINRVRRVPKTREEAMAAFARSWRRGKLPAPNLAPVKRITPQILGAHSIMRKTKERDGNCHVSVAVTDFEFKVNLVAVVRVQAADESVAREVVPDVLGSPGSAE